MRFYLILILVTSFNCNAQLDFYCNYSDQFDKVDLPVQLDWVHTDRLIFSRLNAIIEIKTVDDILKMFPNALDGNCNCNSTSYDLGRGLTSTIHEVHGGYGSVTISFINYKNLVLKYRFIINNHYQILKEHLANDIKFKAICINGKPGFEKLVPENVKLFNDQDGKLFAETDEMNSKRKDAINYFLDDLASGTFAKPYYVLFGLSGAFDYVRYFIVNKDYEALENLLFATNPTARFIAARTLKYMKAKYKYKPNSQVASAITQSLNNGQLISSGVISCWTNNFDYNYYDLNKNFEIYLKME